MANAIIIALLILSVGGAVYYIYKAKKSGRKCIGCPDSGTCATKSACSCCRGCHHEEE